MKINGKNLEIDEEGYLINPGDWDQAVGEGMARLEELELVSEHWVVFGLMRSHYEENGVAPDVRHIFKQLSIDMKISKKEAKAKLFSLFPYGYVQQACKISGMKRPRGWSTG